MKDDDLMKKASKDFIKFINSRDVKELVESTCTDTKEKQFELQKKIKVFEELDSTAFHDSSDIKNTMTEDE